MKTMIRSFAALSLIALAASACSQQMPGQVIPTGTPTPDAVQPGQSGGKEPGSLPSAQPTAVPGATMSLKGKVYDEKGAPVSGAKVTVKALGEGQTYQTTVDVQQGAYIVNGIPQGVLIQVTAAKDGWTQRSQIASAATSRDEFSINFGGPDNAYFISDYPEISAVEPLHDAEDVDAGKLTYKLTLSEPLDDSSKRRFENAVRILPANAAAGGGTDLEVDEDVYPFSKTEAVGAYAIKKGSQWLQDANKVAKISWSADGLTATLDFDAPLLTNQDDKAKYQVVLVSDGTRMLDKSGKQLGTSENGSLTAYPATGNMIAGAFQAKDLALKEIASLSDVEKRWAATHLNATNFEVKQDETEPKLTAAAVGAVGNDTRIELTFDKPMAAYNGAANGFQDAELLNLAHYTFALGANGQSLDGVKLDGVPAATVDATAASGYGASGEREKEFRFADGSVQIKIDPMDAKRVFLVLQNKPNFFNAETNAIKVRVEGVKDPAGNAITSRSADAQAMTGAI